MALSLGPIWRLWTWWEKNSACPSLLTIHHHEILAVWASFWTFTPLPRYVNVPGLFGQPNTANILSWHYLWDPYGGFGHDGRRIQPALPSLPSTIMKFLAVWASFWTFPPLPRYVNVPGLFGQPNTANILSWHYLWDPYGGFGHDGRRIQPALPSLPSTIVKFWLSGPVFELLPPSKICKCSWIVWPT